MFQLISRGLQVLQTAPLSIIVGVIAAYSSWKFFSKYIAATQVQPIFLITKPPTVVIVMSPVRVIISYFKGEKKLAFSSNGTVKRRK